VKEEKTKREGRNWETDLERKIDWVVKGVGRSTAACE